MRRLLPLLLLASAQARQAPDDLNLRLARFHSHYASFVRKYLGCPAAAREISECDPKFGAVDYRARVWLNGQELGGHEGAFTPFEFDISQAARAGTNRLVVRVSDAARNFLKYYCGLPGWDRPSWEPIDGIEFDRIPAGFQDWREGFNHSGIWQPVEVIAHHPVYVADAFILPKLASGAVEARLEIVNKTGKAVEARVALDIKPYKDVAGTGGSDRMVRLEPGSNTILLHAEIRQVHAWSPEDPFLYVAEASVFDGNQRIDDLPARFG